MAALDWIMCMAIAVMEFVVGQMGREADASLHAPFYNSTPPRRISCPLVRQCEPLRLLPEPKRCQYRPTSQSLSFKVFGTCEG